ncbi:hypothetical protein BaRGS_00004456 [Batillaria attramentaria]|uniref:Uncharacterized protein n=1 Tax=Batillaria attramentaria TaxID=370345 RepID=A0ABD0LXC9_9CAEN
MHAHDLVLVQLATTPTPAFTPSTCRVAWDPPIPLSPVACSRPVPFLSASTAFPDGMFVCDMRASENCSNTWRVGYFCNPNE